MLSRKSAMAILWVKASSQNFAVSICSDLASDWVNFHAPVFFFLLFFSCLSTSYMQFRVAIEQDAKSRDMM